MKKCLRVIRIMSYKTHIKNTRQNIICIHKKCLQVIRIISYKTHIKNIKQNIIRI